MNTKMKVVTRLNKDLIPDYIIKRFDEKYQDNIKSKDLKSLKEHIKQFREIRFIIFEDYNLPHLHYRLYSYDITYQEIVEDYFSDCEGGYLNVSELGVIYDVEKDKFVKVGLGVIYDVEKDKFVKVGFEVKETITEV